MARTRLSVASIRRGADAATRRDAGIRETVRNLTLKALRDRSLDPSEIKVVVKAMTEGIATGAARRSGDMRAALSQAFAGLDEAVGKAAEAAHLTLRELIARSRDLNDHELRRALDNVRRMEKDFLSTVGKAANSAQIKVQRELRDIVTHAQRAGTDTGAKVAATLSEFSTSMGSVMAVSARAGFQTTRSVGTRFAELAGGMLDGMADALKTDSQQVRSKSREHSHDRKASTRVKTQVRTAKGTQ